MRRSSVSGSILVLFFTFVAGCGAPPAPGERALREFHAEEGDASLLLQIAESEVELAQSASSPSGTSSDATTAAEPRCAGEIQLDATIARPKVLSFARVNPELIKGKVQPRATAPKVQFESCGSLTQACDASNAALFGNTITHPRADLFRVKFYCASNLHCGMRTRSLVKRQGQCFVSAWSYLGEIAPTAPVR